MTDRRTDRRTEFSSLDRVCISCSAVKTEIFHSPKLRHLSPGRRLRAKQNTSLTRSGERDHFQFVVGALKLFHAWTYNNLVLVSKLWINGKNAFTAAHTKLYCTWWIAVVMILYEHTQKLSCTLLNVNVSRVECI